MYIASEARRKAVAWSMAEACQSKRARKHKRVQAHLRDSLIRGSATPRRKFASAIPTRFHDSGVPGPQASSGHRRPDYRASRSRGPSGRAPSDPAQVRPVLVPGALRGRGPPAGGRLLAVGGLSGGERPLGRRRNRATFAEVPASAPAEFGRRNPRCLVRSTWGLSAGVEVAHAWKWHIRWCPEARGQTTCRASGVAFRTPTRSSCFCTPYLYALASTCWRLRRKSCS